MPGVGGPPTALRRNDSQPRLKVAPSLFRRESLLRTIGLSLSYPGIWAGTNTTHFDCGDPIGLKGLVRISGSCVTSNIQAERRPGGARNSRLDAGLGTQGFLAVSRQGGRFTAQTEGICTSSSWKRVRESLAETWCAPFPSSQRKGTKTAQTVAGVSKLHLTRRDRKKPKPGSYI